MPGSTKVVELGPRASTAGEAELLASRLKQQSILTDFGWRALEGEELDQLLDEAVRLSAQGVNADFCKVLQYLPETDQLHVRAGVGWRPGVVGNTALEVELESPSGFVFRTGTRSSPTTSSTNNASARRRCWSSTA